VAERAQAFPLGDIVVGEGDAVDSRASAQRRPAPVAANGTSRDGHTRAGFARDYYELALDDGGVYRVFHDLRTDRWFVDGVYD
jgi:hypothetical protein